jgi:hypothetical protein
MTSREPVRSLPAQHLILASRSLLISALLWKGSHLLSAYEDALECMGLQAWDEV